MENLFFTTRAQNKQSNRKYNGEVIKPVIFAGYLIGQNAFLHGDDGPLSAFPW